MYILISRQPTLRPSTTCKLGTAVTCIHLSLEFLVDLFQRGGNLRRKVSRGSKDPGTATRCPYMTVALQGVECTGVALNNATDDTLTCTTPEGDGFRFVYVIRNGLRSAPLEMRYARPVASSSACYDSSRALTDFCAPGGLLLVEVGSITPKSIF